MSFRILTWLLCMMLMTVSTQASLFQKKPVEAITFVTEPGRLFVPVEEAAKKLRWPVTRDEKGHVVQINALPVAAGSLRQLTDGTELVSQEDLRKAGAVVSEPEADGAITIGRGWKYLKLKAPPQKVEVSLKEQRLRGWQGERLVLDTNISSGKNGGTPAGEFTAGPYRARMHRSSLYNNAPMPWSVQVRGHIFVHGYTSVPNYPASHGCIRMPLTGRNPAKFFYEWVQTGTPVSVQK